MSKLKTIMLILFCLANLIPLTAIAVRTVPGEVPVLQPLQPPPENTHPNLSGSIQNQSTDSTSTSAEESDNKAPAALEDLQDTLPLPLPESHRSAWAWLVLALILITLGSGIGYWIHVHPSNKK